MEDKQHTDELRDQRLIENAAMCCQVKGLIDNESINECIKLNVCRPLRAEIEALETLNRELATELKEWRIRFPSNDPTIARRMVEDRARAERDAEAASAKVPLTIFTGE